MDKNQKELINTYIRKRLMVPPLELQEFKYAAYNGYIKEKIDATTYNAYVIIYLSTNDINLIKFFDFKNYDSYNLENIIEYIDVEIEDGNLNNNQKDIILNYIFKNFNVDNLDLADINHLLKYYPYLEKYLKQRQEILQQQTYDQINMNKHKLHNNG